MEEEIRALEKNKTWSKCVIPKGKKMVGCRWVFTVKCKADILLKGKKLDWWQKAIPKLMGLIILKLFLL